MREKHLLNYMAVDQDGIFVAVIAGTRPDKEIANAVGEWIRQGDSIERCDDEYVRKHFGDKIR